MTALHWIVKEAKKLKKEYPKRYTKWTDYVKQASAIYASKHKGKSPVGKKKAVAKKVAVKKVAKKKVGVIKKKAAKKPSEQSILNKIHKVKHDVERLDESQHKHMSGISMLNAMKHSYNEMLKREKKYLEVQKYIFDENITIEYLKNSLKNSKNLQEKNIIKNRLFSAKKYLSELKKHAAELKKHI
jgi:hypothetical protein